MFFAELSGLAYQLPEKSLLFLAVQEKSEIRKKLRYKPFYRCAEKQIYITNGQTQKRLVKLKFGGDYAFGYSSPRYCSNHIRRTVTSAGFTPDMRAACPTLRGLTRSSF